MISEVLREDFIQLDMEVEDFEEAIITAMAPMREADVISQNYIDEVVAITKSLGPYIVITPHIALPHAPTVAGAKQLGLGFTRLKRAVISGHKENDPVQFLFPLSAPDQDSHLAALSELAECLSDEEFIKMLSAVETKTEFINYFKKIEGIDEDV